MIEHACTRRLAKIHADIEAVRLVRFEECRLGTLNQHADFSELLDREISERRQVAIRHHHHMAVVVWIQVQDDVAGVALEDDQRARFGFAGRLAEDAAGLGLAAGDVLKPPGRPEAIHEKSKVKSEKSKVSQEVDL